MQEMQVPSLSWEDPLEKELAPHSSILAWGIPWIEEPGMLYSMEQQSWHDLATTNKDNKGCCICKLIPSKLNTTNKEQCNVQDRPVAIRTIKA